MACYVSPADCGSGVSVASRPKFGSVLRTLWDFRVPLAQYAVVHCTSYLSVGPIAESECVILAVARLTSQFHIDSMWPLKGTHRMQRLI